MNRILDIIIEHGAGDAAYLKFSDCTIINPKLLERLSFTPQSVIIATVPYYTEYCNANKTVSSYALAYDYHIYLKNIADETIKKAKALFPEASFASFADHSPINEKEAAAKAGLGIIGVHSLLITPKHSSFVFLLEILTDLKCEKSAHNILYCNKCNSCVMACPGFLQGKSECLSAITQKKGVLSAEESYMISTYGTVWGCDICQMACPHTQNAINKGTIYTKSGWFGNNICSSPSETTINDEQDFKNRAYSWRGKDTILRNIKIIDGKNK